MQEEGFPESPAMSFQFRIKLFALCLGNILVMILWQKVCPSARDQAADLLYTLPSCVLLRGLSIKVESACVSSKLTASAGTVRH